MLEEINGGFLVYGVRVVYCLVIVCLMVWCEDKVKMLKGCVVKVVKCWRVCCDVNLF